nr:hypothetical protein Iba_chr14cCG4190 [Ipomoea batatas]
MLLSNLRSLSLATQQRPMKDLGGFPLFLAEQAAGGSGGLSSFPVSGVATTWVNSRRRGVAVSEQQPTTAEGDNNDDDGAKQRCSGEDGSQPRRHSLLLGVLQAAAVLTSEQRDGISGSELRVFLFAMKQRAVAWLGVARRTPNGDNLRKDSGECFPQQRGSNYTFPSVLPGVCRSRVAAVEGSGVSPFRSAVTERLNGTGLPVVFSRSANKDGASSSGTTQRQRLRAVV